MSEQKIPKDIISESDFTLGMNSRSTRPEKDSPADSESDASSEFYMGIGFVPNLEDTSENFEKQTQHPVKKIPESAWVVDSETPSPRRDQGSDSDTH